MERRYSEPCGIACESAAARLYRRHPHQVRGTNQIRKSGPKTRSFSFPDRPAGPTSRFCTRVTELLRRIEDIVGPTINGMGYELVRVAMSRGGTLQIMVEPADGRAMDVEACAVISRALSAVLDVEDPIPGSYTLEVSSPGIDRPLTRTKDYTRWVGHLARLEMRVFFEELFARLQSIELAGEPRRSASTFVGGPKTLPVRFALS